MSSNPRDLLRCYMAPPPLTVPMQTEVRSDGGMKLHMLRAPFWNANPGAKSILRWSGSVSSVSASASPSPLAALWQMLVKPDPTTGKSPEQLINEWITDPSVAGYYLGTFVTEPQASNGNYGQNVEVQALFTTQGNPANLVMKINRAIATGLPASVAGILKPLLTTYCGTSDSSPWAAQNLSFSGPGVASIFRWSGMLNNQSALDTLKNYLSTTSSGMLPENLINDALAKLLVGYYLGTFVRDPPTFPARIQVLLGLNSTLRSDEKLGNPNNKVYNEYSVGNILNSMSDPTQAYPDALNALQRLLQDIGSAVNAPDPPWFMLSQMDVRVIDPNAP